MKKRMKLFLMFTLMLICSLVRDVYAGIGESTTTLDADVKVTITMVLCGSAVFIVIIALAVKSYKKAIEKDKVCTLSVKAQIIDFKKHSTQYGVSYKPVYEYFYNEKRYTYNSIIKSYNNKSAIGTYTNLLINPNKPSQAYEEGEIHNAKLYIVIGIGCVITVIITAIVCFYLA